MLADSGRQVAGVLTWVWLGGALLFFCLMGPFLMMAINRRLPWAICERLVRRRRPISCRTSYSGGAWNPARPLGRGNRTENKPGRATYRLTADGRVQLNIAYEDGRQEHFVGPPVKLPGRARRVRRAGLVPALAYLTITVSAFAIGYLATYGSDGRRIEFGLFAALAGCVLAWLVLTMASGVWSRRLTRTEGGDAE